MIMHWITCVEGGPRRVNHAAAVVGNFIYSFGGYCTGEDSKEYRPMDVHVLNINTFRWLKVPQPPTTTTTTSNTQMDSFFVPFQRYGHSAVAFRKKIYIWGGRNDEIACNVLYEFDTVSNCWSIPDVKGLIPGARDGHSACLHDHRMYIFGGFEEEEETFSQEVYMLDLIQVQWTYIQTVGQPPSYRDFHSAVVLRNRMYIFGGRGDRTYNTNDEETYSSQIVYLDLNTYRWHKPLTEGDEPTGRRSHSAFVHNGNMYIFGGYNGNLDKHFNEIYRYEPEASVWRRVAPLGKCPSERRRQACVVVDDRMYLFGGTSPSPSCTRRHHHSSEEDETLDLLDHSDLHVMDFNPTLRTLAMLAVINCNLDVNCLPTSLRNEIEMMVTRNLITTPLDANIQLLRIQ